MKLGPRACALCPTGTRQGCYRCGARDRHRHVDVYDRHGTPLGSAVACADHAPDRVSAAPIGRPTGTPAISSLAKRTRDRAYRLATSIIRERYYDEFATEYAKALDEDQEVAA